MGIIHSGNVEPRHATKDAKDSLEGSRGQCESAAILRANIAKAMPAHTADAAYVPSTTVGKLEGRNAKRATWARIS